MVTKGLTFLKPKQSLVGRLESLVDACLWEIDSETGEMKNPKFELIKIEHKIPTKLLKHRREETIFESFENYKKIIQEQYTEELFKTLVDLGKLNEGTKKHSELKEKSTAIDNFLRNIDVRLRLDGPFGRGKYKTYHCVVPFLEKNEQNFFLSQEFIRDRYNSPTRQARLQAGFPFGIVKEIEDGDGGFEFTNELISDKILVNVKGVALDFETQEWKRVRVQEELRDEPEEKLCSRFLNLVDAYNETFNKENLKWMDRRDYLRGIEEILDKNKNERLTAASVISLDSGENFLITTLDCGMNEIEVAVPGDDTDKRKVKIIHVCDQHELVEKLNALYSEIEPVFCYGHNQLKFDYDKAESLTGNFKVGVGGTKPLLEVQAAGGFIKRIILKGRLDIDPSPYSQHYMKNFNNKLDTVLEDVLGIKSKKTLTHDELVVQTALAEKGNKEAAFQVLYYAAQDSMKSWMIGEQLKYEHILKSKALHSSPARIDTTAKKTLCEDYWVNWYWDHKNTYPKDEIISLKIRLGDQVRKGLGTKKNEITFDDFCSIDYFTARIKKYVNLDAKKGVRKGVWVELFPFASIFKDMLERDDNIKKIYNQAFLTGDPKEKARLMRTLESIAEYPLFRLAKPNIGKKTFAAEFSLGMQGDYLDEYRCKATSVMNDLIKLLKGNVININQEAFILSDNVDKNLLCRLESKGLCSVVGEGVFLSGNKGSFAGNIGNQFVMQGIADYNSNKGERCKFEKGLYESFLDKVVLKGDLRVGLEYVAKKANQLRLGKIRREELTYEREARKDYDKYALGARQRYISIMAEQQIKKGDLISYEYNLEAMMEKFFGIVTNENKQLLKKFKAYDKSRKAQEKNKCSGELFEFNLEKVDRPSIREGTIHKLVNYFCGFKKNSAGHYLLNKLYQGDCSVVDKIISLVNIKRSLENKLEL